MGKRRQAGENIENTPPVYQQNLQNSIDHMNNMKTRSTKSQAAHHVIEDVNSEDCAILEELAESVASGSVIEIEIPYETISPSKSPLAESSINEQTPEKGSGVDTLPVPGTTPTTNLKILCAAVDHDESLSSEYGEPVRTDPVTPTANLKMLITAASPEIRSLELSKSRLFADEDDEEEDQMYEDDEPPKRIPGSKVSTARKQKSLGILCCR